MNRGPESTNDLEHDIADVQAALARAARHARERARKFRTTVVIEENGQVQHLDPNEPDTSSTPNARRESAAPETAELRELRLSEYRKLSIDDRIQFIREICDSIAFDCVGSTELPGWQKRELDEALKAYSQNPDVGSGWAGVEARIRTGIREVSKRE